MLNFELQFTSLDILCGICVASFIVYYFLGQFLFCRVPVETHTVESKTSVKSLEQRDFYPEELREFNGTNGKPILIAIKGRVFDVTAKADFYGPGAGYHMFAGRDASRALAKMSFEPEDLESDLLDDLAFIERETLDDWEQKFELFNNYPIVGRVIKRRDMTKDELLKCNGTNGGSICIALKGVIYDVTTKGAGFYGAGGAYSVIAGRDASRALATMKLDSEVVENPTLKDLTETQNKTLEEWVKKFQDKYLVVGKVISS